jgi:hypothetical protein
MADRITPRIDQLREQIAKGLRTDGKPLAPGALDTLRANVGVDFETHAFFQDTQSWAHASGIISYEEAQVVYGALGEVYSPENDGYAAGVDLAAKVIINQLMFELLTLKRRMK